MQKWQHTLQIVRLSPVGKIFDLARKEELASISPVCAQAVQVEPDSHGAYLWFI